MTREADRDLVARLKAKLASAALRGEHTPAELAEQFRRIDEWARQLEHDSGAAAPRPQVAAAQMQAGLDGPATAPPPPLPTRPERQAQLQASAVQRAPALPAILQVPAVPQMPSRANAPTLPTMRAPTLPEARALSRIPTLPSILQVPAVPQMPARSRAPTLPAARPPTVSQTPARLRAPTLPVFQGLPQWPEVPQSPTWPEPALGDTLDDDFWENRVQGAGEPAGDSVAAAPASPSPGASAASRPRRRFRPFVGWRERHHAAKTSRQLLKLHRKLAAAHPRSSKQELYRLIVMARLGGTAQAADAVLSRAAESFATWPVERALTFRDVVHYLAVSDYLGSDAELAEWTRENLGRVVAEFVPDTF